MDKIAKPAGVHFKINLGILNVKIDRAVVAEQSRCWMDNCANHVKAKKSPEKDGRWVGGRMDGGKICFEDCLQ